MSNHDDASGVVPQTKKHLICCEKLQKTIYDICSVELDEIQELKTKEIQMHRETSYDANHYE